MKGDLPWGLVILGAVLAIVMQLAGVSALAFAVGVYLPLSTTMPIFVGGLIRALVDRVRKFTAEESDMSPGTMMSTGLIAGGSLAGIIIALLVVFEKAGPGRRFLDPGARAASRGIACRHRGLRRPRGCALGRCPHRQAAGGRRGQGRTWEAEV